MRNDSYFPCEMAHTAGRRSRTVPTSVHRLRPGDIQVIGAMGDSLTAAAGAQARSILQVATEYRGVSWSGGTIITGRPAMYCVRSSALSISNYKMLCVPRRRVRS